MNATNIPRPALMLGLLGLLPFFLTSGLTVTAAHSSGEFLIPTEMAVMALGAYGAVILSFLGGVRWGALLGNEQQIEQWIPLTLSVVPSLLAWPALMLPSAIMLCVLSAGFVYQFIRDRNAAERREVPEWYGRLRFILTCGAVLSLMVPVLVSVG